MSYSPRSLFRVHLLVEDERHDVLECSVAGISLARSACHSLALGVMERGDERKATLVLSRPNGEEAHVVTIRLAARGPAHVEFAFVMLPASVRHLLEQIGPIRSADASSEVESDDAASPFPRRLILSLSEAVAEITRGRRSMSALPETPPLAPPEAAVPEDTPASIGMLVVVMVGMMALAALMGILLFR